MEHASMDEPKKKQICSKLVGEEASKFFVYTSETKRTDIPKQTVTHLRVDSSVTEIPVKAFKHCDALVHVQLPCTLTKIGESAFLYCSNLKSVQVVSDRSLETSSIVPNSKDGLFVFAERSKLHIDDEAFSYCQSLRKVIVCSVSTRLGRGVFYNCYGLISVELPEGLRVIDPNLFQKCKSLTTVKIPSSVIKIGEFAFVGCRSLTSFELPDGLLEIGHGSFYGCGSIETIQIPTTVSSIRMNAFGRCSGLKYIRLPPVLERIEPFLCSGCKLLESIEIPTAVKIIDRRAFYDCPSLSHIRIPPAVDSFGYDASLGCSSLISIEIPQGTTFDIDLSGCLSLVNIAGPAVNIEVEFMDDFLHYSKLGSVVDGLDELVDRLKHRFDDSPLNKLCYYQSYYSSSDAMLQLRSLMKDDPLAATTQVDEFGMTPLHILSLSQSPNLDMLLAVMEGGHWDHIITGKDSFGSTPMDYLCLNRMPNSTQVIRRVLQKRFDYWLRWDWSWESQVWHQAVEEALAAEWSSRREEIVVVYFKLAHYERKEILSLMELCLWKAMIDEVGSKKGDNEGRQCCRINSGASIVIPHVLPFLGELDGEDYFARSP
eukprot:scaffold530_cov107-Cylindrotheca_fusiformis.AAC.3